MVICLHCCSIPVTFPLDLLKTRLQVQGELSKRGVTYRGTVGTAFGIGKGQNSVIISRY